MALYRHVASGTVPGESWSFTLWSNGNISLQAAQTAWTNATAALFSTAVLALMSIDTNNTEVATAEVDVATGLQSQRVAAAVARAGTAAASSLPFQVTAAVSLRTAFATRRGRGRFYLPPFATTAVANARVSGSAVATLVTAVGNMFDALQAASLTPVVYSRTSRAALTITSFDIGNVFDTQRRRRNKLIEQRTSAVV